MQSQTLKSDSAPLKQRNTTSASRSKKLHPEKTDIARRVWATEPPLGQMLGSPFSNSNGQQRAGIPKLAAGSSSQTSEVPALRPSGSVPASRIQGDQTARQDHRPARSYEYKKTNDVGPIVQIAGRNVKKTGNNPQV